MLFSMTVLCERTFSLFAATLCLFLYALSLSAQPDISPDSLFRQGNQLLNQEKFAEAAEAYENVIAAGRHSKDLHYNLGNAYFGADSLGLAILHYERALKLDPNFTAAEENRLFARDLILKKGGSYPEIFYRRWLRTAAGRLSPTAWAITAVLLIWLALWSGVRYLRAAQPALKKRFFVLAAAFWLSSVAAALAGTGRYLQLADDSYAILLSELETLRSGPSLESSGVLELSAGNKFEIVETTGGGWAKVVLPDGQTGWLPSEAVARI